MSTLYHYVHCPYCVRVRMACGFLKIDFKSRVLPYDDEKTPIDLAGKKMLPIMKFQDKVQNESLEIIETLDPENNLDWRDVNYEEVEAVCNLLGKTVHNLAMPYWIHTQEFNDSSREYFQKKKEAKRGPFKDLVKNRFIFHEEMQSKLEGLVSELKPFYQSDEFTIKDIMISAHLWGLYIVPEWQFDKTIHHYLQKVSELCDFNYHEDYWR